MCLKTQSPWPIPEETGQIGNMLLEEKDPYRLIDDQLLEQWKEGKFADPHSSEGKPMTDSAASIVYLPEKAARAGHVVPFH